MKVMIYYRCMIIFLLKRTDIHITSRKTRTHRRVIRAHIKPLNSALLFTFLELLK